MRVLNIVLTLWTIVTGLAIQRADYDDYSVLDRRGRFNTPTEASGEPPSTTSTPHHLTAPTTISIKKEADKVEPGMGKAMVIFIAVISTTVIILAIVVDDSDPKQDPNPLNTINILIGCGAIALIGIILTLFCTQLVTRCYYRRHFKKKYIRTNVTVPLESATGQTVNPSTCCQSGPDTNRQRIELMNVQQEICSSLASQNQSLREVINLVRSQVHQDDQQRPHDAPPAYAEPNPQAPVEANVVVNENFNADNPIENEYEGPLINVLPDVPSNRIILLQIIRDLFFRNPASSG